LPTWLAGGVLAAGTVLLFSRSFATVSSITTTRFYLTNNEQVRAGLTWPGLVWAFTGHTAYWHPLTWLSHMLDWQLFGANPTGHASSAAAWHAANAVLVFALFRRLRSRVALALRRRPFRLASAARRIGGVGDRAQGRDERLLFPAHAWSWLGYLQARREGRPSVGSYGRTLAFFLAGLMCKPSLVTAPLVLLALDFWPGGRFAADANSGACCWRKSRSC